MLALALAATMVLPVATLISGGADAQTGPEPLAVVPVTESMVLNYTGRIVQAAYSPDGRHLAVAVEDGPIQVLNASTLAPELNFTTQPSWISVSSLSWGPNSDKIGVGYEGGAAAVWRVPGGTNAWAKSGLNYDVKGVSWSPDGKFLAAGIVHSVLIYWGENGYLNATISLDYGGSQPAGLSWSHDSDFIAVGQQALSPAGAIVALFDAKSWGKSLGWRWVGPQMDNVAFEGRGRFLAVQLGGSRAEVWEVRNWTLFSNVTSLSGLEQFAWTADGSRLVTLETEPSASPNQTEDRGGFELLRLGGGAGNSSAMGVSPDGLTVAVGYVDGRVRLLDVGGDRLFDDLTPLVGTTGDPLTFSVSSTAPGTVQVTTTDAAGGRASTSDLALAGGRHTLTVNIPSDWQGPMLYTFTQPSRSVSAPQRQLRVLDNDAPAVATWEFSRGGPSGEAVTANVTVVDNIRIQSATFMLAVDGVAAASATAGDNSTLSFSLSASVAPQNQTVRLEVRAIDASLNGGSIFEVQIPLVDLVAPEFGADLSVPGTAGGRIQLGTAATDARGPPTVNVTWRELTATGEGPWSSFTFGTPSPGSNAFATTFPLGRTAVAVEYSFLARDSAGNTNATPTRVQPVLDREPPEVVVDLSDREALQGDPFHLGIVVRDNIGATSVLAFVQEDGGDPLRIDLTAWAEYGAGAFEGNLTVGAEARQLAYSFFVTDFEGNTVSSGTRTLAVKDNDPPTIRILESVLKFTAGSAFTFHVEVSDRSDVGNLTVYFKRAGEANYLQEEFLADARSGTVLKTARFSVPLASLGIQTLRDGRAIEIYLFSMDGALNGGTLGAPTAPVRIEVLDGAPPVARIQLVGDLVVGSLVSFDGSSSEDDLGLVEFVWTVDDLEVGNRSALAWRFDSTGGHDVRLTVRDAANNTASQSMHVTVASAPVTSAPVGGTLTWVVVGAAAAGAAILVVMRLRKPKKPEGE